MKHLPQASLLASTLLLGLGIGAGGVYVARPWIDPSPTPPAAANATLAEPPPPAPKQAPSPPQAPAPPPNEAPPAAAAAPAQSTPPATAAPPRQALPDAERALKGVQSGEFLPLEKLTALLRERFPGEVLAVKLDEDDGRISYEFKVLTKAGRLMEIEMDPRTGRVIDIDEDDD